MERSRFITFAIKAQIFSIYDVEIEYRGQRPISLIVPRALKFYSRVKKKEKNFIRL